MSGSPALAAAEFDSRRLESVFRDCFEASERTLLIGGADEPLYLPAASGRPLHELYYRADYFASALHEAAHWCIAGAARRKLVDFGYWYAPEGRDAGQQRAFEAVEVQPQALEWIFSLASGYPFQVSVDNFSPDGEAPDTREFRRQVTTQARQWQSRGLPVRAGRFFAGLVAEFATRLDLAQLPIDSRNLR